MKPLFILFTACLLLGTVGASLLISPASAQLPPTPTQEFSNQQRASVGNLLRNVRTCPDTDCAYVYALPARSSFWFCWQIASVQADGYTWVKLPDGNWTSVSFGRKQYVTFQERYRTEEGCK